MGIHAVTGVAPEPVMAELVGLVGGTRLASGAAGAPVLLRLAAIGGALTSVPDARHWEPAYGRPAEAQRKWEEQHGRPLPPAPGHGL